MIFALLACEDDPDRDAALARADAVLDAEPKGTLIVLASTDGHLEASGGSVWHGADLAQRIDRCAAEDFSATVDLAPGGFPWDVDDAPECVRNQLATFPFEAPTRSGERAVVRVRWRPSEPEPALAAPTSERGARALVPPYWRRSEAGLDLRFDDERVLVRESADLRAGRLWNPSAWVGQLTCTGELQLVRTSLVFRRGELLEVHTTPEVDCVESHAWASANWMLRQSIEGDVIGDGGAWLVVVEVPVTPPPGSTPSTDAPTGDAATKDAP